MEDQYLRLTLALHGFGTILLAMIVAALHASKPSKSDLEELRSKLMAEQQKGLMDTKENLAKLSHRVRKLDPTDE